MLKFVPLIILLLFWLLVRELRMRRQCPKCRVWVRPILEKKRHWFRMKVTGYVTCPLCGNRWQEDHLEGLPGVEDEKPPKRK